MAKKKHTDEFSVKNSMIFERSDRKKADEDGAAPKKPKNRKRLAMGIVATILIVFIGIPSWENRALPSYQLLFAGMAGGKCVTMACNYRNTIGFSLWNDCHWQSSYFDSLRDAPHTVSLPRANCCLLNWRGSALGSLV